MFSFKKTQQQMMEQCCAICDVQGFIIDKRFHAREIAIVSDSISICQEFSTGIDWNDLSEKDKQQIRYTTKKIHGLPYNPSFDSRKNPLLISNQAGDYIISIYKNIFSEEKPLLGVKNDHMKTILIEAGLPYLDLNSEVYNCPSVGSLENYYGNKWTCAYHIKIPLNKIQQRQQIVNYRCAYRKCFYFWRWMKCEVKDNQNIQSEDHVD